MWNIKLDEEAVKERTDTTIKMANVAGQTAETVSDQMTAVWNNFYDGSKSIEYYADVMVKLGAATASSTDEIAEGLEKFAAIGNTVGLSYEYATAALTTITSNTRQSADVVGTALKTIFARIQGLSLGETLDDGLDLNKYSKALEAVGINILDANGEIVKMDSLLDQMGEKWETLSNAQQIALAQTVAGVRQYNQLTSLMENWDSGDADSMQANLRYIEESEGELQRQADIYAESWEAARDRMTASAEDIYDSLINPDLFIGMDDIFTPLLSGIADIIDATGGLSGVLTIAGTAMASLYGDKIASGMSSIVSNLGFAVNYEQIKARLIQQEAADLNSRKIEEDELLQLENQFMEVRQQANIESDNLNARQKKILDSDIEELEILKEQVKTLKERAAAMSSSIDEDAKKIIESAPDRIATRRALSATNQRDSDYIQEVFTNYERNTGAITTEKAEVEALTQEYIYLSEEIARIGMIEQIFSNSNRDILKTREEVKAMGREFELTGQAVGLFFEDLEPTEALKLMENEIDDLIKKTELLREEMIQRDANTRPLDDIPVKTDTSQENLGAANRQQEEFKRKIEEINATIDAQGYRVESNSEKIVKWGARLGQAAMALSAFQSLGRVFTDEDMTTGERLIAIFTSLSMILPLVGSATNLLTTSLSAQVAAEEILKVVQGEKNASEIKNIVLRRLAVAATEKLKDEEGAYTASLVTEEIAQKAVNASLLTFIAQAALVVMALTAITVLIYTLVKEYNKEADAANHAAEAAEQMATAADEAKTAAENLRSSIEKYDSAVEKLEECAHGTEEWRDALKEVNAAIIEVLNNAGKLSADDIKNLRNDDGSLNKYTLEKLQEKADQQATKADFASSAAQKYANDASLRATATTLSRQVTSDRENNVNNSRDDTQIILDHYKELANLSDADLVPALRSLGFYIENTEESVNLWKSTLDSMVESAESAAEKFNLISQMQVEQVLGPAESLYDQAVESIVTSNTDALTQSLTQEWTDKLTGDGINRFSGSTNDIYQETLRALQAAGYNYTSTTDNAVRGSSSNRELAFKNAEGEDEVLNAETWAAMIGAANALDQISDNASVAKSALQSLDEDALAYINDENFSNITKEALKKFMDEDAILEAFGGEDGIKAIIAAQEDINISEVGTNMVNDFINGVATAAEGAESDFSKVGIGEKFAHSVQTALEDIDTSELSLSEFQDVADIFNLANAYGKLDEAIDAYEAGSLEEFAEGIREVTSSLDDFQSKYAELHDIMDGISTGDTISEEDYNKLSEAGQSYFREMADGTYQLIGNAAEFQDVVQQELINISSQNRQALLEDQQQYASVQNYDIQGLSKSIGKQDIDVDNAAVIQQQLNLIKALGDQSEETKEKIAAWQEQLNERHFDSVDSLQQIADMVVDCGSAFENLSETMTSNNAAILGWEQQIASSCTSLKELREYLEQDVISTETFNKAAQNLDTILDTQDLDTEEWENYSDYLQETVDSLKDNDKAARTVAKSIMKMNDGVEDLADNFDDWRDILEHSADDSEEYADALTGTRKALANLLDISEDYVSKDFIASHLDEIQQAATGDAEAIDNLKAALSEDIIIGIVGVDSLQDLPVEIANKWQWLQDYLANADFSLGEIDDQTFIDGLNELISQTGMTVDQVNALCDSLGFEAAYDTEPQETTYTVPIYETLTKDNGTHTITADDGQTYTMISTITETRQIGTQTMTGEYATFAMDVAAEGSKAVPKITGLTKKAGGSYNNRSSRNAGGNSGGGGSGGSGGGGGSSGKTLDTEEKKQWRDVEDRYHNINRQLERQADLLDDIGTSASRAYGQDKVKKFEENITALTKKQDLLNSKLQEAETYLTQDAAEVKKYFSGAQIDANGEITNYEELLRLNMDLYNAEVDRYNLAVDGKELAEEEAESLKAQLEDAQTAFDDRQKALDQYESTLDEIRTTTDSIEENLRAIADQKLEEIQYKLEVVIDIKSMVDSLRDLQKEIAEAFGDALTHGIETAKLSVEGAEKEAALFPNYQEQYSELKALYESTIDDADRSAIMDEIQNLQGKIIDSASALVQWANSIEDIIPDAVDAASERFELFTDQLEHNTSILDTITELYALQGITYKTMAGFNRLQKVSQEKLESQVANAVLQQSWYKEAEARLIEAQTKLDSLNGDESDIRYDTYKKARDAYLEEFNEAQEAYLSSAQEAMETAQKMYTQQIEKAVYEFGQIISNGVGLDLLQEQYDHYIEESERYLDTVNEAYQVASWYNKLQKDIDESINSAQTEKLKALQKEIDARRENNTLSEYDLEILEAKYNVLQAQMALEDAQNAKDNLQLVRDSQGNWNYQYTADQDKIADAEQGLLDAQNEWYNIAKQQVTDVTSEIVNMWKECQDKVEEIYTDDNLTYEEKLAAAEEVRNYYSEKAQYLEEEKNIAIKDMNEAGSEALIDITKTTGEETADLIGEFTNVYADQLSEMTQTNMNFEERLNELLNQAEQDFLDYRDTVNKVAQETDTTLSDLAEQTDKVSESTDELRERGLDLADALWEQISATETATGEYLNLASSIWEVVTAMEELAAQQANYTAAMNSYDSSLDYSALMGTVDVDSDEFEQYMINRDQKIAEGFGGSNVASTERIAAFYQKGLTLEGEGYKSFNDISEADWKRLVGFESGGYTGSFDNAKLAFLHEKELVLNQEDTANILAAVQAVRDFGPNLFASIEKALDSNAVAAMALLGTKLTASMIAPQSGTLEQTVHIDKVEFPNATNRTEIEEAFINLTNDAAQWARRKT